MTFARNVSLTVIAGLVTGIVVRVVLTTAPAAGARTPKPVITSVEPAYGSSVGYAHLIIRSHHLKGGTVAEDGQPLQKSRPVILDMAPR